jgi:hypothetical protein
MKLITYIILIFNEIETGYNIEYVAKMDKFKYFTKVYLIDLSSSLLKIVRKRIEDN